MTQGFQPPGWAEGSPTQLQESLSEAQTHRLGSLICSPSSGATTRTSAATSPTRPSTRGQGEDASKSEEMLRRVSQKQSESRGWKTAAPQQRGA